MHGVKNMVEEVGVEALHLRTGVWGALLPEVFFFGRFISKFTF